MFSQIVGGITLSILAMIAIDDFIRSSGKENGPIAKRNALKAEHADD
ncbi:MAG: hypothetical protein IPH83_21060 [Gammaproteobacteria bacterium]|nr:hypothetical protein [Gammaproteobacteria bacterium]